MKNNFLFFYFFVSIIISKDFDLLLSVYSDVYDNSAVFFVTPNPNKIDIEHKYIPFSFLVEDSFLSSWADRSHMRIPYDFKDSLNLNMSEFAGKIMKIPSKLKKDLLPGVGSSIYDYIFSMPQDSLILKSKKIENEKREFAIQFFSMKRALRNIDSKISWINRDSIILRIDIYSPNLDSIDVKYYNDYRDKDNFENLQRNKIKRNGEPVFSTSTKLISNFQFNGAAGIEFSYKNPENIILVDVITLNQKLANQISEKQSQIPIIILASIIGIMVIFIVILITKKIIDNRKERF